MTIIDSIKNPILEELKLFENTFIESLRTDNPMLESVHEYVLQKTGKKLRPMIVILSAKMLGKVNSSTIDAAISLELLHTASLIHDDVVDDTSERRGNASVHTRWTNKIAILSGDYILSKGLSSAVKTNNLDILKSIANIGMQLSDGELLQLINTKISETSEANYFTIIRKKTALLFSTCSEVGGLSVSADKTALAHLKNFGEFLGICFQIKDDIFDYSDNTNIGKPTGNDLKDGKVTLPLIYAILNSKDNLKEDVLKWIENKDFTPEKIKAIADFTFQNGGVEYALYQMELYKNKAISEINNFPDSDVKKSLILCAEFATQRIN